MMYCEPSTYILLHYDPKFEVSDVTPKVIFADFKN
jgi:hypothetical protein